MYATGFGIRKGKKAIKFLNSWGEKWGEDGCGWLNEDYFNAQRVFRAWVLVDKPNVEPADKSMRYVIDQNNDQWLIADAPIKIAVSISDLTALEELKRRGLSGSPERVLSLEGYLTYRGATETSWNAFLNL